MNDEENVPRRLKRFQRQGEESPTPRLKEDPKREEIAPLHERPNRPEVEKQSIMQNLKRQLSHNTNESHHDSIQKNAQVMAMNKVEQFKQQKGRLPEGKELEEIAESLFDEVKEKKQEMRQEKKMEDQSNAKSTDASQPVHGRFRRNVEEKPKSEIPLPEQPMGKNKRFQGNAASPTQPPAPKQPSTVNVSELFGSNPEQKKKIPAEKKQETDDFDLGALTESLGGAEDLEKELALDPELEGIQKELETKNNKCPTCATKTEELAICPKCATVFCSHCAKTAKNIGIEIEYTCPKCGKTSKSRKGSKPKLNG